MRVTSGEGMERAAGWSPDGTRFAFSQVINGTQSLAVVKPTGNASPGILKSKISNWLPDWSPDSKWLTYADENASWHLLSVDGKEDREIGKLDSWSLTFSRDGRSLYGIRVIGNDASLIAYDLATSKTRIVKQLDKSLIPAANLGPGIRFTLTPDGKSISYSVQKNATSQIWMMQGFKAPSSGWGGWRWPWGTGG